MRVLLDTHVFLWTINEPSRLSAPAHRIIADAGNELLFSAVSAWEIAIKTRMDKLRLPDAPERYVPKHLETASIGVLPVQLSHALHTTTLPDHHRDPFDRLLVAQAQLEKLPIITADPQIGRYAVKIIW